MRFLKFVAPPLHRHDKLEGTNSAGHRCHGAKLTMAIFGMMESKDVDD